MDNDERLPRTWQLPPLNSSARVRLVTAAPGSGKTWLLSEVIRQELGRWRSRSAGLAALSFTNVASDEIRKAVGHSLSHPHFGGTLDAFLYRSVVQPFAGWAYPLPISAPHLVPAEYVAHLSSQHWYAKSLMIETGRGAEMMNLFAFDFAGRHASKAPQFRYKAHGRMILTQEALSRKVLRRKQELWSRSGRMSHSDVAYLAAEILGNSPRGRWVRKLLARRYPFILLDELQDTGRYHSLAIRRLLKEPPVRAFIVGDPDQAIFGFNGADGMLFHHFADLEGCDEVAMDVSGRCPQKVCAIASQLCTRGRTILHTDDAPVGRAVLLLHDGNPRSILELAEEISTALPSGNVKVVTRKNDDVDLLITGQSPEKPDFRSAALSAMYDAVSNWRAGRRRASHAHVEAAFGRMLFDSPTTSEQDRAAVGIRPIDWIRAMGAALLQASRHTPGESAYEWGLRTKELLRTILRERGWDKCCPKVALPRAPHKSTKKVIAFSATVTPPRGRVSIETVHAVKGETHHTTILFVPACTSPDKCISVTWWSDDPAEEERRVGFVAVTRPKDTLVIGIDHETYERLCATRPEFVALFTVADVRSLEDARVVLGLRESCHVVPSRE